jgi:hypothetical protein
VPAQAITILTTSSQTIDTIASGSIKMITPNETLVFTSDNANWQLS